MLCEQCGYALDGLPASGACPECGRAIARSRPESRPGSPWQRRASWGALLGTWWGVLARREALWGGVSIEARSAATLLLVTLALASATMALSTLAPTAAAHGARWWYPPIFFVISWFVLLALTSIEFTGMRFFGRRRRWRTTPGVALVICAHASVGWLIGGMGVALGWIVGGNLPGLTGSGLLWMAVFAPFIGGMVVFSLLAGSGFHALRFVNDPAHRAAEDSL